MVFSSVGQGLRECVCGGGGSRAGGEGWPRAGPALVSEARADWDLAEVPAGDGVLEVHLGPALEEELGDLVVPARGGPREGAGELSSRRGGFWRRLSCVAR